MAEGQRMTATDVVAQVRDGRLEDFVREAVVLVARELMEAEVSEQVGAGHGEVAPEARVTHRNGYRPRPWETRVGEIELLIPRVRQGSYFPSFLEPRRRSEQAIVAVVLETYVNGVSTRKVDRLAEQLGIEGMTKDRVSAMCRGLDEQVELFRGRPLDGAYPVLVAGRQARQGPRPRPRREQGSRRRLCRARDRAARGDRPGPRRGRVGQLLGRVPAQPQEARPDRGQAGDL